MRIALLCSALALMVPVTGAAGPVETGRAKFFAGDFLGADTDFAMALSILPNTDDQEAHAFLSITRVLRVAQEEAAGPSPALRDSLKELLDAFGFATAGRSILDWTSQPPRDVNGHLALPANSPTGGEVQSYLAGPPVNAVGAALADLAALSPSFSTVVTGAEIQQLLLALGLNAALGSDVTIARGELQLWEAALHTLRSKLLVLTAYDLGIDLDQVTQVGFVWNLQAKVLDPNPNLLDLESAGATILGEVHSDLVASIDAYKAASQTIRTRPVCTPARCLLRIESPGDLAWEVKFRSDLDRFRASLVSCTYFSQDTALFGTLIVNPCPLLGAGSYTAMNFRDLLPPFQYDSNASPPSYGNACELPDSTFHGSFPVGSVAPVNLARGYLRPCGDRWQDAPVAVRGLIRGSLVGATTDGSSSLGGEPDAWYRYTAAGAETLELAACGADNETILSVHSAGPGVLGNEVAAAYEWSQSDHPADCYAYPALIAVPLAANQTVWIRVAAGSSDSIDTAGFFLRVPEPGASALGACAVAVLGLVVRLRRN